MPDVLFASAIRTHAELVNSGLDDADLTDDQLGQRYELSKFMPDLAEKSWNSLRQTMLRGAEGRGLAESFGAVLANVNQSIDACEHLRGSLERRPTAEDRDIRLATLGANLLRLKRVKDYLQTVLDQLTQPAPTIDPERWARAESQGYERGDAILARLRAGGSL